MKPFFTDEEIVQGLRGKNPRLTDAIVTFLYENCQRTVTRMVLKNSGNDFEADDLFQEVMMLFLHNVRQEKFELREDTKIKTYICDVARLRWLKELRSRKSRTKRNGIFGQKQEADTEPEENWLETDEIIRASLVFNQLKERCREVLTAFYFGNQSLSQIAERFGYSSVEYAKLAKFRCFQNLKELIHQP